MADDFRMKGWRDMAVRVESERDRAMAEEFLDNLRVNTAIEQVRGGSMPKVVDPDSRQAGLVQRPAKRGVS